MPDADALVIAPTPPFYRWTFASLWAPGPLEARPQRSYYYVTDVDANWPQERQEEHLRDMNDAVLWSISMHEALPGHFLHFEHLRKVASPWRKAMVVAPVSVLEGWAHYAEHMVVEQGFAKNDPVIELGQLAESLVRLCRLVVGLRLHAEDLSVEQGVRFFREEAMLEEASARREAERGAFDPGYVIYALGKLMLLKLRKDAQAHQGAGFDLHRFHDDFLGHGPAAVQRAASADARRRQRRGCARLSRMPAYRSDSQSPALRSRVITCHCTSTNATPAVTASR